MSSLDPLIPFILYYECGLTPAQAMLPAEQAFEIARRRGFSDDPLDRGGATMCGVTLATYRTYKGADATAEDLHHISYAEWRSILHRLYWQPWHADDIHCQRIAELLVDWHWASGAVAIRLTQNLLGVTADGVVGPRTLAAINSADPADLFSRLHTLRRDFIHRIVQRRPSQRRFLRGWLRRLDAIAWEELRYE